MSSSEQERPLGMSPPCSSGVAPSIPTGTFGSRVLNPGLAESKGVEPPPPPPPAGRIWTPPRGVLANHGETDFANVSFNGPFRDPPFFLTQTGVLCPTESTVSTGGHAFPVAMEQPFPPRATMVPWKQMIGFEVLLLTNTLVILESTTYVVGTGSPSMAREGGGMTAQSPLTAVCPNQSLSESTPSLIGLPRSCCHCVAG